MMEYGTNIAAGVTPGKGGQKFEDRVPIYNSVKEAVDSSGAQISIMFVPAKFFLSAAKEAIEAELGYSWLFLNMCQFVMPCKLSNC